MIQKTQANLFVLASIFVKYAENIFKQAVRQHLCGVAKELIQAHFVNAGIILP